MIDEKDQLVVAAAVAAAAVAAAAVVAAAVVASVFDVPAPVASLHPSKETNSNLLLLLFLSKFSIVLELIFFRLFFTQFHASPFIHYLSL
jgi:hypothetical protein